MFERAVEDLVRVDPPLARLVAHVLEHGAEGVAGLLGQLVFHHEFLEERLFERLPGMAPKLVGAAAPGGRQGQCLGHCAFRRRSVRKEKTIQSNSKEQNGRFFGITKKRRHSQEFLNKKKSTQNRVECFQNLGEKRIAFEHERIFLINSKCPNYSFSARNSIIYLCSVYI